MPFLWSALQRDAFDEIAGEFTVILFKYKFSSQYRLRYRQDWLLLGPLHRGYPGTAARWYYGY